MQPPVKTAHYQPPIPPGIVINIAVAIILTIITCGLYGLYWQYKQFEAVNAFLGRKEYDFAMWFLLGIVTCGIFVVYYEYKMADSINEVKVQRGRRIDGNLPLICLFLTLFGLGLVSLAIQQNEINALCNVSRDY